MKIYDTISIPVFKKKKKKPLNQKIKNMSK